MQWDDKLPNGASHTERDYKVCDLCGALNPATKSDCFVCGWTGQFRTDKETVGEVMRNLALELGGLPESIFEPEPIPSKLPQPGFTAKIRRFLKKIFCRA